MLGSTATVTCACGCVYLCVCVLVSPANEISLELNVIVGVSHNLLGLAHDSPHQFLLNTKKRGGGEDGGIRIGFVINKSANAKARTTPSCTTTNHPHAGIYTILFGWTACARFGSSPEKGGEGEV